MAEELQRYVVKIDIITDTRQMQAGIQQATTQLGNLEKTVGRVGRSFVSFMAIMAGREVLQQIGSAVSGYADFHFQLALTGRAAEISGKQLEGLGEALRKVSLDTGVAIEDLQTISLEAARAGIKTSSEMTKLSSTISKFSTITGTSAGVATTSIIKLQKNFGYSAEQIASSIAWAGKEVLATEADITQAVLRMIDSGKTLGIDFPTLVGLAAVSLESAGQRASRVGNEWSAAIRQMVINADLIAVSIGLDTQAFRELINTHPDQALFLIAEELNKIEDNSRKVQLETKLFGSTGGKVLPYLREQLAKTKDIISGVNTELRTGGKYLEEAWGKISDELKTKINKLNTSFVDLKLTIADLIDEPLADFIVSTTNWLKEFNVEVKKSGLLIASLKGAMGFGLAGMLGGNLGEKSVSPAGDLLTDRAKEILNAINLGTIEVTKGGKTDPFAAIRPEIDAEAQKIKEMKDMWTAYRSEELAATMQKNQTEIEQYSFMIDTQKKAHSSLWSVVGNLRDTFSAGISNMFMEMIKGTFDAKKAFADLGLQMLQILIDWAVQKAVNMALEWALMPVIKLMASTMASIWAVPAFLAEVASMGGASVAAVTSLGFGAAVAQGIGQFQKGGLVPGIGRGDKVPALLEPGEYVVPRNRVNQMTNNSYAPIVNVSMAGALIMDNPVAIQKLYREYLRDAIRNDIRSGRDKFYGE